MQVTLTHYCEELLPPDLLVEVSFLLVFVILNFEINRSL